MTAYLRFLEPATNVLLFDLPIESFSITVALNQSTTWSATINTEVLGINQILRGLTIEFYDDGEFVFEGILQSFSPDLVQPNTLALSGRSFLDNLYGTPAYPIAYYDQKALLGVLVEILLHGDWGIGDIGTLEDVDQTLTKDLRGETSLLSQINALVNGIPRTYWREGLTRLGTRTIDIGLFMQVSNLVALFPDNLVHYDGDDENLHVITAFTYKIDFVDAFYAVRAEGGNISDGAERIINLGDAISHTPLLRVDDEFQIIEEANEKVWSVVNVRDFPYPGGQVISTDDTLTGAVATWPFGDAAGGASESNFHHLYTFIPFPGILRSATIRLGARDASFTTELGSVFDVYWRIYEVDPANNNTVVAIVHHQVIPASTFPAANMALRLIPDTEVILESGKLYGVGIGLTSGPTSDLVRQSVFIGNRTATSQVFGARTLNIPGGTLPIIGSVFNSSIGANLVPAMVVITDKTDPFLAGSTTQKQPKFAPPKTGAASPAAEIQRAGLSLYNWAKNYLIEHPAEKKEYTMKTLGTKNLPRVGDTIYVKGRALLEIYDTISHQVNFETFEDVNTDLRITQYTANWTGNHIEVDYTLTDGDGIPQTDRILAQYDVTEKKRPPEGSILTSLWGLLLDTITVSIGPVMPDAEFADGTAATEVTVSIFDGSVPSLPTNTEWVYLGGNPYGVSPSGDLRIEVTEEPEFTSTGQVTFLVGFQNRGWQYGDTADLTVKLVWR